MQRDSGRRASSDPQRELQADLSREKEELTTSETRKVLSPAYGPVTFRVTLLTRNLSFQGSFMQTLFGSQGGATPDLNGVGSSQPAYDCPTRCDACGMRAPTRYAAFHQHIGAVVLMFHQRRGGNLCQGCIKEIFRSTTLTTLAVGWWGMISMFITPCVLIHNVVRYLIVRESSSSAPSPAPYAATTDRKL